jgi:hypothetical protein
MPCCLWSKEVLGSPGMLQDIPISPSPASRSHGVLLSRELASAQETDHNICWIASHTWMRQHRCLDDLKYAQVIQKQDPQAALGSGKIPCCMQWSCSVMGPGSVSYSSVQLRRLLLTW